MVPYRPYFPLVSNLLHVRSHDLMAFEGRFRLVLADDVVQPIEPPPVLLDGVDDHVRRRGAGLPRSCWSPAPGVLIGWTAATGSARSWAALRGIEVFWAPHCRPPDTSGGQHREKRLPLSSAAPDHDHRVRQYLVSAADQQHPSVKPNPEEKSSRRPGIPLGRNIALDFAHPVESSIHIGVVAGR
jgi:hypothetical protein